MDIGNVNKIEVHWDCNKTIFAEDPVSGKTAEETVLTAISEELIQAWGGEHEETLYNYFTRLSAEKVRGEEPDLESSNKKAFKTTVKEGAREHFRKANAFIEEFYAEDQIMLEKINRRIQLAHTALAAQEGDMLFKSFYKALNDLGKLSKMGIKVRFCIRTFGTDGEKVTKELNRKIRGIISRFVTTKRHNVLVETQEGTVDAIALKTFLDANEGNFAIQDDFKYWNNSGRLAAFGKPFYAKDERHVVRMFFDDNAHLNLAHPEKNIVCAFEDEGPIDPGVAIQKGQIRPVDMLDAIIDEDYFSRKIQQTIEMHNARWDAILGKDAGDGAPELPQCEGSSAGKDTTTESVTTTEDVTTTADATTAEPMSTS